jgi:hypothetical protein
VGLWIAVGSISVALLSVALLGPYRFALPRGAPAAEPVAVSA